MMYAAYAKHNVGPRQLALMMEKRGVGGLLQKVLKSAWDCIDKYIILQRKKKRKNRSLYETDIQELYYILNYYKQSKGIK